MEHDEVYGKFVLPFVFVFNFVFLPKMFLFQKTDIASLLPVGVIKNIILSCFNF